MIEIISKIYKPITYKKIINNQIYGRKSRAVIKDELKNMKNYQTYE